MYSSCSESPYVQPTNIFKVTASSSSTLPNDLYPRGLPHDVVIVLISILPTVFALALILGIIHCVRRRNKRKIQVQHQTDIEKSLQLAHRPVLAIDTDIPRANELQRSASSRRLPTPYSTYFVDKDAPPLPQVPPSIRVQATSPLRPMLMRGPTRQTLGSLPPGVGGRKTSPRKPEVYDVENRKAVYLG